MRARPHDSMGQSYDGGARTGARGARERGMEKLSLFDQMFYKLDEAAPERGEAAALTVERPRRRSSSRSPPPGRPWRNREIRLRSSRISSGSPSSAWT